MDGIVQSMKDHDDKNAKRFDSLRKSIVGDELDGEKPGILRRIQTLETHKDKLDAETPGILPRIGSLETYNLRMVRNAQATWGFLLVVVGAIVSQLAGWFGGGKS